MGLPTTALSRSTVLSKPFTEDHLTFLHPSKEGGGVRWFFSSHVGRHHDGA